MRISKAAGETAIAAAHGADEGRKTGQGVARSAVPALPLCMYAGYPEGVIEVHFTREQLQRLAQIAAHAGTDTGQLVRDATLRLVDEVARYRNAVREGIAQADRSELIDHEEAGRWLEERERS